MGLFSAFRSTSNVASEFKKKFTEACQFFIDVSYEPSRYSMNTIHAKKYAYMSELVDFCRYRVSDPCNEAFNIYTNGAELIVRLNMAAGLIIAQRYIEEMENGNKLSATRTDAIIDDVRTNATMSDYYRVIDLYS